MIPVTGMAHLGLRVGNFDRSVRFYSILGFRVIRDDRTERVMVLKHPRGMEINLLDSADHTNGNRNILMDEPHRYPGYTHLALRVDDIDATTRGIGLLGIAITEGPVTFGDGSVSIFIRDPDRNVIEFSQPDSHPDARRETRQGGEV